VDYISGERAACLFKGATRELRVVLLLHSANVRVNTITFTFGDVEIGSLGEVSQNLQNSKSHSSESNRKHLFPYTA
jgi:hypothetical protein